VDGEAAATDSSSYSARYRSGASPKFTSTPRSIAIAGLSGRDVEISLGAAARRLVGGSRIERCSGSRLYQRVRLPIHQLPAPSSNREIIVMPHRPLAVVLHAHSTR
jgi:hypothetical protein